MPGGKRWNSIIDMFNEVDGRRALSDVVAVVRVEVTRQTAETVWAALAFRGRPSRALPFSCWTVGRHVEKRSESEAAVILVKDQL